MALHTGSRALALVARPSPSLTLPTQLASRPLWRNTAVAIGLFRLVALPNVQWKIPSILAGLWESILRAVPKKKTSHRKKRQRFLAGKALKDVTHLNRCPACGSAKRAHLLCPFCVREIKDIWQGRDVTGKKAEAKLNSPVDQ